MKKSKNIDLIKAFAIYFVLLNHFGVLAYNIIEDKLYFDLFLIYRSFLGVAVALFLMVSGYLIAEKKYDLNKIIKRVIQFIILIFLFKFIYALSFANAQFSLKSIIYFFSTTAAKGYRVNSLWYMYALVGIYLLLPFIQKIYQDKKMYLYLCLLVSIYSFIIVPIELVFKANNGYDMQVFNVMFPFNSHYIFALGYFLVGGLIKKYEFKIKEFPIKTSMLIIIMVLMLIVQSFFSIYITNVSLNTFDPMYDGYKTITNLITSFCLFILFKYQIKEVNNKYIEYISKNSLAIYLLHWPIAYYVKNFLFNYFTINVYISNVIGTVVVLLICLAITYLINLNKSISKFMK
ncbi:surface polysaccharide O-acyltransferase-like enzyme [Bacilli bacterium PM5-3]|nr:surface polysaccharide O-acyltransferase-like enzyme [Bacilli bacterium PM5-3]MDH6604238.1 surface polysaccharide O-acyltransferase-like enzyme [Bacilli bacterium PM5-9]